MFLLFDQKVLTELALSKRGVKNKAENIFNPLINHGAYTSGIMEVQFSPADFKTYIA